MAIAVALLFLVATLQISSADESPLSVSIGPCSGVPNVDWRESINANLRRIPNNLTFMPSLEGNSAAGVEIGPPTLSGLGNLWVYKPYHAYCAGGKSFIEATAFALEPLIATAGYTSCSGATGSLGMKVTSSQIRVIFRALPTSDDPAHVEIFKFYPDSLEDAELFVTGASKEMTTFVKYISVIMKPHMEQFWRYLLPLDAQFLIRNRSPA